jgi:hypothetical protein
MRKRGNRLRAIRLSGRTRSRALPPLSARLPEFLGAPPDLAHRIPGLRVAVVGVGAVGAQAALHLARLSVRSLILIDPKSFKAESLLTQPVGPEAVGRPKVRHVGNLCKRISPGTEILTWRGGVRDLDPLILSAVDAIVLATDNLAAELDAGHVAKVLGKPLLQGSVHGSTLTAQVRVFANRDENSPCPGCGFGEREWHLLGLETTFSCDPAGDLAADPGAGEPVLLPTESVSSLCSLAADLTVIHLLRHVGGFGAPVADTIHGYCACNNTAYTSPLKRKESCRCDHTRWSFLPLSGPLGSLSFAILASHARLGVPVPGDTLAEVGGHVWVSRLACPNGHEQDHHRFVPAANLPELPCPDCGEELFCPPASRSASVSLGTLGVRCLDPLIDLGITRTDWIRLRGADRTIAFHRRLSHPTP